MCGIAGVYDPTAPVDPALMARMLSVLNHRGPDEMETFTEFPISLGHCRLSILDPSPAGRQPMIDAGDRFVITYNGEIYNYRELRRELERAGARFLSRGDTEVLLAAYAHWGESCLGRLNGMFAFAIYDRVERSVFCARDRLGVKPLVYARDGRRFSFASEHKALVAADLIDRQASPEAMYEYIARGYTTGERSFFAQATNMPPGHALRVTPNSFSTWRWWSPQGSADITEARSRREWIQSVAELLEDAVRLRLRSDAPLAAALSGGLDSSVVVALAARNMSEPLSTFTGAFPEDPASDERRYSRAVAAACRVQAREVEIDLDDLAFQFDRILWHMDEPLAGPGAFPQLRVYDAASASGTRVMLGGQGGDELFGGYVRHQLLHLRSQISKGSVVDRTQAAVALVVLAASNWRRKLRASARVEDADLHGDFLDVIDAGFRREVRGSPMSFDSSAELMSWDVLNYLPALLHVDDRMGMASSIEARSPFLDYRLAEMLAAIPEHHKLGSLASKRLLREAAASWLPPVVVRRRDKRGFPTPLHSWRRKSALRRLVLRLTGPEDGPLSEGPLTAAACSSQFPPVFRPEFLARPEAMSSGLLWTVMSIQGWLRLPGRDATPAPHRAAG